MMLPEVGRSTLSSGGEQADRGPGLQGEGQMRLNPRRVLLLLLPEPPRF